MREIKNNKMENLLKELEEKEEFDCVFYRCGPNDCRPDKSSCISY